MSGTCSRRAAGSAAGNDARRRCAVRLLASTDQLVFSVNYSCRRIASPNLLPGDHRCLTIPATEGGDDVDDQCGNTTGAGNRGGGPVSAEHGSREEVDLGRVRGSHRVPPQARGPRPQRKCHHAAGAARAPVRLRRGRDRGADRSVGGVGPDVRQAAEGAAADPGAGARASRPLVPGPGGARAAPGGECRDDSTAAWRPRGP